MDHLYTRLPGVVSGRFCKGEEVSLKKLSAEDGRHIIALDPLGAESHRHYLEFKVAVHDCDTIFRMVCLLHMWIMNNTVQDLDPLDERQLSEFLEVEVFSVNRPLM